MYVDTIVTARVQDREYALQAVKPSFSGEVGTGEPGERPDREVKFRIEIREDETGAGTHDRVIVAQVYATSRFQANGLFRTLVEVATHHYGNPFED